MSEQISNELTFVLGGARSGKSSWALNYAESTHEKLLFIATAEIIDEEMAERVRLHKESRSARWNLIEEPLEISDVLEKRTDGYDVVLIDCLTIWLGNVLFKLGKDVTELYMEQLYRTLCLKTNEIIIVANEVGLGIVPERESGRIFRDFAGILNQRISAIADKVVFTVAGIPMFLKGKK
jgi:adenosylcobinamide kinase/adenosylcobinamide-phosphate guanylyltransferase